MSKDASGTESSTNTTDVDKIFEDRGPKTIIRLVTVGAYMFSVSFAALVLSGYYIFLWHPPNSRLIHAHAAHLRSDSEMEFLVDDSLIVIQENKSNRLEHKNALKEAEANNRYKYISSPIQVITQNNRFTDMKNDVNTEVIVQSDEELTSKDAYKKNKRIQRSRNNVVEKQDSNIINFMERNNDSTSSIYEQISNEIPVLVDKENAKIQATDFSINSIIYNNIAMKPENSTSKRKLSVEHSKSKSKEKSSTDCVE